MKNLLVIRNDKIGDFMLTWAALAMLKQSAPSIKITALVPAYTANLAELCPYIDDIILDNTNSTLSEIKVKQFDGVISFFSNTANGKLVWKAKIPYRLAPATKLIQFLYNHRVVQRRSRSTKAEFEYNLDLARAFLQKQNIPIIEPQRPFLQFETEIIQQQRQKLAQQLNLDLNKKWIFVHTTTGGSANNLCHSQYAELIQSILTKFDCHFLLTAAVNEKDQAQELQRLINDERIRVYADNDGLIDFSTSLACADLFISGSTGPLHIAGALNKPTIGFYPANRSASPIRWRPLNDPKIHLAFTPPACKENEKKLTLIQIAEVLKTILPFISKLYA